MGKWLLRCLRASKAEIELVIHVTPVISLRSPSLCIVTNYYYAEYKNLGPQGKL
jgi:hypothetical protein